MRAEAKPNGDVVLVVTNGELGDVENALMNGEEVCREFAKVPSGSTDCRLYAEEAADWLAQLGTAICTAIGRRRRIELE